MGLAIFRFLFIFHTFQHTLVIFLNARRFFHTTQKVQGRFRTRFGLMKYNETQQTYQG